MMKLIRYSVLLWAILIALIFLFVIVLPFIISSYLPLWMIICLMTIAPIGVAVSLIYIIDYFYKKEFLNVEQSKKQSAAEG